MHESLQRAQSMVTSLRPDFIPFMTFVQILSLCLSSSHDKCTSAREVKRFTHWGPLKHYYLILYWNFKTYKWQTVSQVLLLPLTLLCSPTAAPTVSLPRNCAQRWRSFCPCSWSPFLSPWTHQALQVGISHNSGNFQSCNFILALAAYSATSLLETKALFIQFRNMSSLSLTSIPTLFE